MPADLDLRLLSGFSFACRPGCALCCFATPAVSVEERPKLLAIAPSLTLLPGRGEFGFIPSRPNGGACELLHDLACSAHTARPFPCRTFPITVYLGDRAQAGLVLSCPGLDLTRLNGWIAKERRPVSPGLDEELATVLRELERPRTIRRQERAREEVERATRRLETEGRWTNGRPRGGRLINDALRYARDRFPAPPPPPVSDGLETLPLTFDEAFGRVALAGDPPNWSLIALGNGEGLHSTLGTYLEPSRAPSLEPDAEALLRGYLTYASARSSLNGQILHALLSGDDRTVSEAFEEEVGLIALQALTRAALLERAHGRSGDRLDARAMAAGVRATDAEVLDRPLVGDVV